MLEIESEVKRIITVLQARGFKSPYLGACVAARINPVQFQRAKKDESQPPMMLAAGLTRMSAGAKKFDPALVRPGDLALVAALVGDGD